MIVELNYPVTFQCVVNTHDGRFHLFEMDYQLPIPPFAGLLLVNVPGVPNVLGPKAGVDNGIRRNVWDHATGRVKCQIAGYRAATETLEEIQVRAMSDWKYIGDISDQTEEASEPEDFLNG